MGWPVSPWGPLISAPVWGLQELTAMPSFSCGCWAPHPGSHDTAAISRSSSNFLNTELTVICCFFFQPKILTMSSRKLPLISKKNLNAFMNLQNQPLAPNSSPQFIKCFHAYQYRGLFSSFLPLGRFLKNVSSVYQVSGLWVNMKKPLRSQLIHEQGT